MNLNTLNTIIQDNLAVNIDISNINSWNLNTGLTVVSLNKYNLANSSDINLPDFGLTAYDNGRTNNINNGLIINQNNNNLSLYRTGYNITGNTLYDNYGIIPITGTSVGNYFLTSGGSLQGFFKLHGYEYEILPQRYNNGITIETLVEILPQTNGIFFYIGTRSEDKYLPYYSGETMILSSSTINHSGNEIGYKYVFTGRTTSENNYLCSFDENVERLNAFSQPENSEVIVFDNVSQKDNLANNLICFEITNDKKFKYKFVDSNGNIVQNTSTKQLTRNGWTVITIVFKPYEIIQNYDQSKCLCYPRRKGDLIFYVNGRIFWKINDFDEFYFKELNTDKEKQIGVPFNITWGGGSFGLKHSWHFNNFTGNTLVQDSRKSNLLVETYFNNNFIGNIQKLRIYNKALNSDEVFHNSKIEANNSNYNIIIHNGGRLI